MKLANMKMSPAEDKSNMVMEAKSPEYPYGLKIHLSEQVIQKLGMEEMPAVEKQCIIHAKGYVCSVNVSQSEDYGTDRSISIQITDLEVIPEKAEKLKETNIEVSKKFYSQDDKEY